jgi:hypothetical protein
MPTDWHPQDWIMIVEALSVYDQWRDRDDDKARRIYELQREIATEHGFDAPSEFVRQAD